MTRERPARGRPLLVGEDNPHSDDPEKALHVEFPGAAGSRLAAILGMSPDEYLSAFDRVNLLPHAPEWDRWLARDRAVEILEGLGDSPPLIVLLGARVADAFGVEFEPFTVVRGALATYAVLPHPSGRCHIWNDPLTKQQARDCLANAAAGDKATDLERAAA
jgi:hypothetical protein